MDVIATESWKKNCNLNVNLPWKQATEKFLYRHILLSFDGEHPKCSASASGNQASWTPIVKAIKILRKLREAPDFKGFLRMFVIA